MANADHITESMRDFLEHKEERLQQLHDLLRTGNYKTGKYYKFTVKSRGMDGQEATSIIYVTQPSAAGAKPEFTEVVR